MPERLYTATTGRLMQAAKIVRKHHPKVTLDKYLAFLCIAQKPDEPMTSVVCLLGKPQSSVSRIVNDLVGEGLVERTQDGENRRQVKLRVAPKGLKMLAELAQVVCVLLAILFAVDVATPHYNISRHIREDLTIAAHAAVEGTFLDFFEDDEDV